MRGRPRGVLDRVNKSIDDEYRLFSKDTRTLDSRFINEKGFGTDRPQKDSVESACVCIRVCPRYRTESGL